MSTRAVFRPARTICAECRHQEAVRRQFSTAGRLLDESSTLPRVAHPSFWRTLIPKPLRRAPSQEASTPSPVQKSRFLTRPRDWNPYTIFILLALLSGSNAIQILALRNDTLKYTRQTEAKLDLLREVVEKVKAGEDVDVRKALGTGDEKAEAEWEAMVKELEESDGLEEGWRRRRERKEARDAAKREGGGSVMLDESKPVKNVVEKIEDDQRTVTEKRPKFMM